MRTTRRQLLQLAGAGAAAMALPSLGRAASAPMFDTAVMVGGFAPGGTVDTLARRAAHGLTGLYAKNMLVENRTGAGGQIAVQFVARAKPDGQTILCTPMSMLGIYRYTYKQLPYDPVKDLDPVSVGVVFDFGFAVGPLVPESVKTVPEFFEWIKKNPNHANYGSPGAGSAPHFVGEVIAQNQGVPLTHVAFRGTQPAIHDLMGGQIAAVSGPVGEFLPHIKDGRVRIIGTTGAERNKFAPDVPTLTEQGLEGLTFSEWFGFFVPAGTPSDVKERLAKDLAVALDQKEAIEGLALMGLEVRTSTPEELRVLLEQDTELWRPIIEKVGFSADS